MRPRPADYVQPGETVLLQQRRHPLSVLDELLAILLGWLVLAGAGFWLVQFSGLPLRPELVPLVWAGIAVVTVGALWLAGYRVLRMLTSLYTVTDHRVYEAHGRLWFHLLQTTYDRVTDLHIRQSPFGRMLGFGTVTLQTAGTGLPLVGIREPLAIKVEVETARTRFLSSLWPRGATTTTTFVEGARKPRSVGAKARAAKVPVAAAPPPPLPSIPDGAVWQGRPSGAWLGAGLLGAVPFVLFGAVFLVMNLGSGGWTWLWGALAVVMGLATAAGVVINYATMRFEVRRHGLVVTSGWLGRKRMETTYEKVTDLEMDQSVAGRIFGFGTLRINTAGGTGTAVTFPGVADPEQVKAVISQARTQRLEAR